MNAKKTIRLFVLGLAGASMLVGCGEKTLTRTEAVTALNTISTKTSASDFKAPTKGVLTGKTTKINVSSEDNFLSIEYTADKKNKSSSVLIASGTKLYCYVNGANFNVYYESGDTKGIYVDSTGLYKTGIAACIATYLAKAKYAASFAKYLGNFNDDGSAVTGGTASDATLTKQSYKSSGDGNLSVEITAHYSYDEAIVYTWSNYLCTRQKSSDDVSFSWGKATTTAPKTDGVANMTLAQAGLYLIALGVIAD